MTFKTRREVVEWLLAGNGVKMPSGNGGRELWFKDGFVDQHGNPMGVAFISAPDTYTPIIHNPHAEGTYEWAKFHHSHGRPVRRRGQHTFHVTTKWANFWFQAADFESTDWELA